MAIYEVQATHVRYWRGQVKRWSTRWTYSGTWSGQDTDLQAFGTQLSAICYSPSASGASYGGLASLSLYNRSAGGPPVAHYQYFDYTTPAAWIGYSSTAWTNRTPVVEGAAEAAMQLYYPAGLSKSGKPVSYRKWIHAIPLGASDTAAANISGAVITSLQAAANGIPGSLGAKGLAFGDGTRTPGSAVVLPYYGNHQMVRGRRKKVLTTKQQSSLFQQIVNAGIANTSSQPGLA